MSLQKSAIAVVTGVLFMCVAFAGEDVDPANDDSQYAYAANLGWVNGEPLGDGGPGIRFFGDVVVGWLWSANTGWISLSCHNTDSCGNVDYGVNHDGDGNLSGYGWSPNIGWVSFSCSDSASCGNVDYSVTVDLESGEMAGFGYAANTGWVGFSCTDRASCGNVDFGIQVNPDRVQGKLFGDGFETS